MLLEGSFDATPRKMALAPVSDTAKKIGRLLIEPQEKKLEELTAQVVKKLLKDISEHGLVLLSHERKTEVLESANFSVRLTSVKLPALRVTLERNYIQPSQPSSELIKLLSNPDPSRMYIQVNEMTPSQRHKGIVVTQGWDMPEDKYKIVYMRNVKEEDWHNPIPRSNGEKMKFLREILATEVDVAATEEYFGKPLIIWDDTKPSSESDKPSTSHFYRVRDMRGQLSGLLGAGHTDNLPSPPLRLR
jgi:hypothetical protein